MVGAVAPIAILRASAWEFDELLQDRRLLRRGGTIRSPGAFPWKSLLDDPFALRTLPGVSVETRVEVFPINLPQLMSNVAHKGCRSSIHVFRFHPNPIFS